jgi:UDP-N-acetylmuramoylalanine-D-glutamate ligase
MSIPVFDTFWKAAKDTDLSLVAIQYDPNREGIATFCGKRGIPMLTHARATGLLLSDRLKGKEIVEVTGACGKTTTVSHIASILRARGGQSVVMSSNGVDIVEQERVFKLDERGSITPAYALRAVRMAYEAGADPDTFVFEVSLGGLGIGTVGAVLGVPLHLEVGVGKSAFFSKAQMAEYARPLSVLCLNADDVPSRRMGMMTSAHVNLFSVHEGANVCPSRVAVRPDTETMHISYEGLRTCRGTVKKGKIEFTPNTGFFGKSAVSNFVAATAIALSLGIDAATVTEGLSTSRPLHNRLVFSRHGHISIISSTATSKETIEHAIEEAHQYTRITGERLSVVVGGKARTTCGAVDYGALATMLNTYSATLPVTLYGELGRMVRDAGCSAPFHDSRKSAIGSHQGVGGVVVTCSN